MRATILVTLGLFASGLAGCTAVESIQPLYTDQEITSDVGLKGTWHCPSSGEDVNALTVSVAEKEPKAGAPQEYQVTLVNVAPPSKYVGRLVRLGGSEFLDLEPEAGSIVAKDAPFIPSMVTTNAIVRVKREGDIVWAGFLNDDWFTQHVPSQQWRKAGEDPLNAFVFIGTTEELQDVMRKAEADRKAFIEFPFLRVSTETYYMGLAALGNAELGELYLTDGAYEKAAHAWEGYIEFQPENAQGHHQLGLARLALGDFAGARAQWREWLRQCAKANCADLREDATPKMSASNELSSGMIPHSLFIGDWLVPSEASGHAHLGFLELVSNNYQDAVREFAEYRRLEPAPQPYPILWNYLALRGAGKDVEARALIERFATCFPKDSRVASLAELVQRKTDAVGEEPGCEAQFYLGMRELLDRNTGKAREAFEKAKASRYYDYYECAAAHAKRKMLATEKRL